MEVIVIDNETYLSETDLRLFLDRQEREGRLIAYDHEMFKEFIERFCKQAKKLTYESGTGVGLPLGAFLANKE